MSTPKAPGTFSSVILWSVISAAFIGPGTVTTAATAGAQFGIDLVWCVSFATIACILLQEISARITIASGLSLGQAVQLKFSGSKGFWSKWIIGISVILGCAAYEAGNILGAVSGISLIVPGDGKIFTILISFAAVLFLWSNQSKWISWLMTWLVAMMGIAFFVLALQGDFKVSTILFKSIVPSWPAGSELIVLGLVGTTIVPYNLFIGSGISKGQTIPLMRVGLAVSVIIGGLITAWILLAGSLVGKFSSFKELAHAFELKMGAVGVWALGVGLFAAGFSSAITSPYAASIIVRSTMDKPGEKYPRLAWMLVLITGFTFGISGVKPIPVILVVQAINGLILPLITLFLILIVNDPKIVPKQFQHSAGYNFILLLILGFVIFIGLNNVDKSISGFLKLEGQHFLISFSVTVIIAVYAFYLIRRK
jgi:Mn2+/Fe2+ NRAMP family transporter